MRRTGCLIVAIAVGIVGCASSPAPERLDVASTLVGRWDDNQEDFCSNAHVISFDRRKKTMLVTYAEKGWATKDDSRQVFSYEILSADSSVFRVRMDGESRLDDKGNPVVWHVVLVDQDTYCWSRDDWPAGECTPPRKRCPG